MEKERLLAFTDGVIAIIITIMVLELKVPQDASLGALAPVIPVFLSYGKRSAHPTLRAATAG